MPRLTSNAASASRFTFWLSFICRSGWPCSLNTCGAFGASKDRSFTYSFSTVKEAACGCAWDSAAAPFRISSDMGDSRECVACGKEDADAIGEYRIE